MRVTVLGCGAAFPRAGGACSGYLVQSDGTNVMVDAGNGTLSNLQRYLSYLDLDALVLTHRHADHIADVIPLMFARGFDESARRALPTYAPEDVVPAVLAPHGEFARDMFTRVFAPVGMNGAFEVGALRFEPFRTVHPVETFGLRISDGSGTVVYTADTATFPELAEACRGASTLLCEATYARDEAGAPGMHMWAREAGEVAASADVGRLALVHIWPTIDPGTSEREAAEAFDGHIEAAVEGAVYTI